MWIGFWGNSVWCLIYTDNHIRHAAWAFKRYVPRGNPYNSMNSENTQTLLFVWVSEACAAFALSPSSWGSRSCCDSRGPRWGCAAHHSATGRVPERCCWSSRCDVSSFWETAPCSPYCPWPPEMKPPPNLDCEEETGLLLHKDTKGLRLVHLGIKYRIFLFWFPLKTTILYAILCNSTLHRFITSCLKFTARTNSCLQLWSCFYSLVFVCTAQVRLFQHLTQLLFIDRSCSVSLHLCLMICARGPSLSAVFSHQMADDRPSPSLVQPEVSSC